jgi:hypothetical protein
MTDFDERDIQILTVALRFWRSRRLGSPVRRGDPAMSPEVIDALLAKLTVIPLRPNDDPLRGLFPR